MHEKPHRFVDLRAWFGKKTEHYRYTQGVAGERFFREIKENGKLLGTRCPKCGRVFLPPRLYCEDCMEYTTEWVPIEGPGHVETYTVLHRDLDDKPLETPRVLAFITWPGIEGGLIHDLGEVEPDEVYVGMPVEPVFKPQEEREGKITDIRYFKPAGD